METHPSTRRDLDRASLACSIRCPDGLDLFTVCLTFEHLYDDRAFTLQEMLLENAAESPHGSSPHWG